MNASGWLQLALYVVVLLYCAKPLGGYMAAVYEGRASRRSASAAGSSGASIAARASIPRAR